MLSNFIRIFTAIAVITALLSGCAAQKKEESLPEASQPTYEEQSYYYYDEQTTETTQEYYEEETTEEAEIFFHNAVSNCVIDEQDGTEFFCNRQTCKRRHMKKPTEKAGFVLLFSWLCRFDGYEQSVELCPVIFFMLP